MRQILRLALAAAMVSGATALPALAHPHIFIDARATIVFDDSGAVRGIRNSWTFDEAFSVWQIQGLDANNDGTTSSEEMQELANENMQGLAEYQYYTFAGEGAEAGNLRFTNGRNARFVHENGLTTLGFDIDLETPYRIKDTLEIAINDPEYYVAITFADVSRVTLENAPEGCAVSLQEGHDMPDDVAEQLYSLPPDVTQLPPELAAALRGVQGAILVKCPRTAAVAPATAVDAVTEVAEARPTPFGGPPPEPGFTMPRTGFLGWVAEQQRHFYAALTGALGRLKADNTAFWVLGGLSFLYGVFHAAGPGHGKVVISSYVLANERQLRQGVALSFASAMLQSVVAVAFVGVAAAALGLTSAAMGVAADWIGIVSYALVALLGLWLIARKVFGLGHSHAAPPRPRRVDMAEKARAHLHELETVDAHGRAPADPHYGHDHGHEAHDHHHDGHHHHHVVTADQLRGDWREQLGVVLAVGLRPCSGALVVLVFALSQGLLPAGIAAVFLMGLGTALTVAVLAAIAVGAKDVAQRLAGGRTSARGAAILWWAELGGAVLVFGFGVVLLLASL